MCATCVAQAGVYVGGAVGALRIMAARAEARRGRAADPRPEPAEQGEVPASDDPSGRAATRTPAS